jgi:HK97 gp10 family phage protein
MAQVITVSHNAADLRAQLNALSKDIEKNIIRAGVRAAGQVFRKQAAKILGRPRLSKVKRGVTPGTLRKSVFVFRSRKSRPGEEIQLVSVRQGKDQRQRKGGSRDAFYWRWVEAGHRIVPRKGRLQKTSRSTRRRMATRSVPAHPFLKPAFTSGQNEAMAAFRKRITDRIAKENAKRTPSKIAA